MRLEDMKNDIPETPDFIHNMIQNEVAKQLTDNKVANLRRRKRWTAPKVAAVAAACVLAVSTAVYAGVNLYHWFLEKQGSYGVSVKIDAGDAAKKTVLPDEVPEVNLSTKYVPEGMSWIDEYHLQYPEHGMTGGFSFSFVLLDKNDLGQVVQDQNVIDSEERTFGKYQGIYLKYNSITESGALNQRIYLVCPDLYRVLMIYIGDDVPKDEAIKVAENLAIERAKKLFGCEYVNVQPHSGAQANMAVQFAMLTPGDKVMGMNLDHGGHLTHGSPVNMSGKYFEITPYGVNEEGVIDYEEVRRIAKECRPKLIIAGASAYARIIDFKKFREIADEVGAYLMVDMAHIAGLVAAGLHPSPIPYAHVTTTTTHKTLRGPRGGMILSSNEMNEKFNFNKAIFPGIQGGPLMHVIAAKAVCFKEALSPDFVAYQEQILKNAKALCNGLLERGVKIVSGGTDNHLMLVDLTGTNVSGKELEKRLDQAHITCNKNTIPNDPRSPFVTSGVRLGTPAVTSRGMKEQEMDQIAEMIAMVIRDEKNVEQVKEMVQKLTEKYPLC